MNLEQAQFEIGALQRRLAEYAGEVQRLRSALQWASDQAKGRLPAWFHDLLKTPAPPIVDRDKARVIAEALKIARGNITWDSLDNNKVMGPIDNALAIAREFGLLQ